MTLWRRDPAAAALAAAQVEKEETYIERLYELVENYYKPLRDSAFSVEGAIISSSKAR